jgi:hypothetical protein
LRFVSYEKTQRKLQQLQNELELGGGLIAEELLIGLVGESDILEARRK